MASGVDFFPRKDGDLSIYLQNFRDKIAVDGKLADFGPARIKATQARCDRVISALTANAKKFAEYKAQVGATNATREADLKALRADIRMIKASPNYTEAIGRDLGISVSPAAAPIAHHDKAEASAVVRGSTVRITWKKGRLSGVNVYMRRQGEGDFTLLGRDNHSPFDDTTPLLKPGTPEIREYRVVGVIKDAEVGAPSDILSALVQG